MTVDKTQVQDPADLEDPAGAEGDEPADHEEGQSLANGKGAAAGDGKTEEEGEEHEPAADHPRFKKVYGRMKGLEREIAEKDKDIEALRNHSRDIITRLEEIEKTKADRPTPKAPDPVADPDAYKAWVEADKLEQKKEFDKELARTRVETLIEVEAGLHPDYDEMVKIAERDSEKDPELKKKIWNSRNPARAAYQYAKSKAEEREKLDKDETERQQRIRNSGVERGGDPPPAASGSDKLGDDEVRVIKNLWPHLPFADAKKKYLANKR
jgi:hypothetical protein